LIVSRLRQHEERQKERTRLIVEAAAFFIAAIGISGILSLVQDGWDIDGHGATLLVSICVVVAFRVTVLLYRFLRISNKRR
jgi:Flp pilus assembly protein TadB